ncbi:hypothetical protein V8E36_007699 [Tilletia maclaganii]
MIATSFISALALIPLSLLASTMVPPALPGPIALTTRQTNGVPTLASTDVKNKIVKTAKLSGAAYCPSVLSGRWSCGLYCDGIPGFQLTDVGGDGAVKQIWYAGWNPSEQEIIVTHQGANSSSLAGVVYPTNLVLQSVDPRVLQTLSAVSTSSVANAMVHTGYQSAWTQTYNDVQAAVQRQLAAHPSALRVLVAGFSQGANLALLDALALRSVLPKSVPIEVSVVGQPRLGDPVFAFAVDAVINTAGQNFSYRHTVNAKDAFPHLPPPSAGYEHSINEAWITQSNSTFNTPVYLCPGHENVNCANSIPDIQLTILDHPGPYLGVPISAANCTS